MPDFCQEEDGTKKYVDVGKCSMKKCKIKEKNFPDQIQCCIAAETIVENINCGGEFAEVAQDQVRCKRRKWSLNYY